jgi:tetratricopeptide (TPR) repeat protein
LSLVEPVTEKPAQSRNNQSSRTSGPFVISGIVMLEDGRPPDQAAEVILACSGVVRQRAYTQAGSGQFTLSIGDSRAPETDITETATDPRGGFKSFNQIGRGFGDDGRWGTGRTTNVSRLYLGDCELTASLPGYKSAVVYPGNRDLLDNPDIGTIRLFSKNPVRRSTVSVKSLAAPEKARKAHENARQELSRTQPDYTKAARELEKAVDICADYAEAWFCLAQCRLKLKDAAHAREAFEKANDADPDYLLPALALAELSLAGGDTHAARTWATRVLERDPTVILASYIHGFASFFLGDIKAAEASILKVRSSHEASAFPGLHYIMGSILAAKGDIPSAATELKLYLQLNPDFEKATEIQQRLADWREKGLLRDADELLPE